MPTSHSGYHVQHTILPDDISTLFAKTLDKFEPIAGESTDLYLAELREVLSQILLVIPYDEENEVHNLIGIIKYPKTYTTDDTAALPRTCYPNIYNTSINDN